MRVEPTDENRPRFPGCSPHSRLLLRPWQSPTMIEAKVESAIKSVTGTQSIHEHRSVSRTAWPAGARPEDASADSPFPETKAFAAWNVDRRRSKAAILTRARDHLVNEITAASLGRPWRAQSCVSLAGASPWISPSGSGSGWNRCAPSLVCARTGAPGRGATRATC